MSPVLTVSDLRVRYPVAGGLPLFRRKDRPSFVDVVHGVTFSIAKGETLAVVGESGSGKTTLAMALCGLAPVFAGEVRFGGQPITAGRHGLLKPDRRRVALMFQDPAGALSPRMSVRRLLAEPFHIHGGASADPDRSALDLLYMVGLGHGLADRYPHQLSGGQARRVGVARAIALRPDLLIADEPTAGLDVSVQGEVLNLLSELQREMGLAIMVITHNLNVVRHVADRMAIMYLGRFVEQGRSDLIFEHPRHPYTGVLLAANPSTDPDAATDRIELKGEVPGLLRRPSGCEFHTRCPVVQPDCSVEFPALTGNPHQQACHCFHPLA